MESSIKLLVRAEKRGPAEQNLTGLSAILGVEIDEVSFSQDFGRADAFLSELFSTGALISSADAMAAVVEKNPAARAGLDYFISHLRFLLIYGLDRCSSESATLLFGSDVITAAPLANQIPRHRYQLPRAGSEISLQLAGMSFDAERRSESAPSLPSGIGGTIKDELTTRIIDCDGMPFFAALRRGGCAIFLLASSDVLDVDARAATGELARHVYPALLPWLLFIRQAAEDRCWRNPAPKACLIIDDPLIRPRYGFLSFAALVESMRRYDYKTTIAFIPWNYSRSTPTATDLFHQEASKLSLCVHGCDHTEAEFGSTDIEALRQKASSALARMRLHEYATGIEWDPVMVFPQGIFSSASLLALQREGYLAAVNSGISSIDRPEANRVADLLVPASKAYSGVPLFKRHYPRDLLPFALDLFLGKQALIVEHHTYFRSGYEEVAAFVGQLKAIEPRLSWSPLGDTLRSAVQYRVTASVVELRAYTDQVLFRRPAHKPEHCRLTKYETDPDSVSAVMVNGREAEYRVEDDRVEVVFEAQGECIVDVLRRPPAPLKTSISNFAYKARVAARRYLSELRDNALAGNTRFLSATAAQRLSRLTMRQKHG